MLGKSIKKGIVVFGIITLGAIVFAPTQHVAPDYLYPNHSLTPGKVDTFSYTDLTALYDGQTYSQAHRNVSSSEKRKVCDEYPDNCKGKVEIDHFCPLALGCSNDIKNLWAQPEHAYWKGQDFGFHTKDKLEAYMVRRMKNKEIMPSVAQACFLEDWVACYLRYFPSTISQLSGVEVDSEDTN